MVVRMVILSALFFAAEVGGDLLAAPTPEQRTELAAITTLLAKAGGLYVEKKPKEAGEAVKEVQARLEKLAENADRQLLLQLVPIYQRLQVAHARFAADGITLPPLKPLPDSGPKSKAQSPKSASKAATSFVKEVAPLLNNHCGRCHVRSARGMFSMASYESLMKGPPSGKVVIGGNLEGSDLIIKIEEKAMPPSGAGIPDADLAKLKKWVREGAKFDGPDAAAQLTSYLPADSASAGTAVGIVRQATGKETISFGRDIAPVLIKSCTGCHNNDNPPADFNLLTMTGLVRGGERGEPILPGQPAESLLIKKLKGTAEGARMPQRAKPLDDATIAKFEKWIEEGATFDGSNPGQPIVQVAAIAKAQSSTHDQLTKDRAALADENWRLGMPGRKPNKSESANFLMLGNLAENMLADIGKKAETLAPKVGKILGAPLDQPLVKGRVTLFVFGERYDYGEFGKMVEKRDIPPAWRGHYRYSVVDAYGVVLLPKTNEYDVEALIAQQLAAVYVASQGKDEKDIPHWFAEGCGRVVATRLADGDDRRIAQWDIDLSSIAGSLSRPDDFLIGKLPQELADVCSFSFAKMLMTDTRRFGNLMENLRKGAAFKAAFTAAYSGPPEQLTVVWMRNPPRAGKGRGK